MKSKPDFARPSRITIPPRAHPLVRLAYLLMKNTATTYSECEWRSGVLMQTLKSWRSEKRPGIASIEAVLGVWGWRLLPCPPLEDVPAHVMQKLEEAGQYFIDDDQTLAAAIFAATSKPHARQATDGPAPRVDNKTSYWLKEQAA